MEISVRPRENWFDPEYVRYWLGQQTGRTAERMHQFLMIRSVVPYRSDHPFRAVDVGGGDGWLAEVLLSRYPAARVTVLDQSPVMLEQAKERLSRFGNRGDTAQGDLRDPEWRAALNGDYGVAVSSIAIHNLADADRIKAVYGEIYSVLADGGCFFNLDYLRGTDALVNEVSRWATSDLEGIWRAPTSQRRTERGREPQTDGAPQQPRGLEDQLSWLKAAGFEPVECFWKEFQTALFGGFKGAVTVPKER